jgi:phage/plasmid-like protein (TIGR03299 family)
MPAMVESMMWVEEDGVPWHKLGTKVQGAQTMEQALTMSGLDWTVGLCDLEAVLPDGERVPVVGKRGVVRSTDHRTLGTVGPDYQPIQNIDAFRFLDSIIGPGQAVYRTAGSLYGGRKTWVLVQLDRTIEVVKGDPILPYLTVANSHDGSMSLRAWMHNVRIVCANTFEMAMRRGGNVYYVYHTGNVMRKVDEAQHLLGLAHKHYDVVEEALGVMAGAKFEAKMVDLWGNALFPDPKKEEEVEAGADAEAKAFREFSQAGRRAKFAELVEVGKGTDIPGVKGTIYGAYQAALEVVDHHFKSFRSDDKELFELWWGDGVKVRATALDLALKASR